MELTPIKKLKKTFKYATLTAVVWLLCTLMCYFLRNNEPTTQSQHSSNNGNIFVYDRTVPLLLLGGMDGISTTFLQSALNHHRDIHCTQVSHLIWSFTSKIQSLHSDKLQLLEAGINDEVMKSAVSAFILDMIASNMRRETSKLPSHWCVLDRFIFTYGRKMPSLFPNTKMVVLVRDGRAIVKQRSIKASNELSEKWLVDKMKKWNFSMRRLLRICLDLKSSCLVVLYESLVTHPQVQTNRIFDFLKLPTTTIPLNASSESSLHGWVDIFPDGLRPNITKAAPMLEILGYDWSGPYNGNNLTVEEIKYRLEKMKWDLFLKRANGTHS